MPDRRTLDFASMEQIMPDVETLLRGHLTVGHWSLAQILNHLATSIKLTTLGRAGSLSKSGSEESRRQFFATRRFPEGVEVPHRRLVPPTGAEAGAEAEALRDAIARFMMAAGPFPAHPLLGPLSKEEWSQFHCIHSAHHLGFASPVCDEIDRTHSLDASRTSGD